MRRQARSRPAPLDWKRWHRWLSNSLTVTTTQLGPDMHNNLEVRRHIFQHLPAIIIDPAQPLGATSWACAGAFMVDDLAREMSWQWLAIAFSGGSVRRRH